jgi:hypothetical protein
MAHQAALILEALVTTDPVSSQVFFDSVFLDFALDIADKVCFDVTKSVIRTLTVVLSNSVFGPRLRSVASSEQYWLHLLVKIILSQLEKMQANQTWDFLNFLCEFAREPCLDLDLVHFFLEKMARYMRLSLSPSEFFFQSDYF